MKNGGLIREDLNRDNTPDIDVNKIVEETIRELELEKSKYGEPATPIASNIQEKAEKDYSGCGCLALTFIICLPVFTSMIFYFSKIFGYIDWEWWRVFLPCTLSYGLVIVLTLITIIAALIISHNEKKKSEKVVNRVKDYKDKLEDVMKEVE